MTEALTAQKLGRLIFRTLSVTGQDEIEVLTDRTSKDRLMVQIHRQKESGQGPETPAPNTVDKQPPAKEVTVTG